MDVQFYGPTSFFPLKKRKIRCLHAQQDQTNPLFITGCDIVINCVSRFDYCSPLALSRCFSSRGFPCFPGARVKRLGNWKMCQRNKAQFDIPIHPRIVLWHARAVCSHNARASSRRQAGNNMDIVQSNLRANLFVQIYQFANAVNVNSIPPCLCTLLKSYQFGEKAPKLLCNRLDLRYAR